MELLQKQIIFRFWENLGSISIFFFLTIQWNNFDCMHFAEWEMETQILSNFS